MFKGEIHLIDKMGDDEAIVEAARVSVLTAKKRSSTRRLIRFLMRHEHWTPFEMVEFKFKVKAPIFVARQWFRHRTGSFNEISARYSEMPMEFHRPDVKDARFSKAYLEAQYAYQDMIAKGVPLESARAVLPVGTYTHFYWKVNLRNMLHFIKLRISQNAQPEIRWYAEKLKIIAQSSVPHAFQAWQDYHCDRVSVHRDVITYLAHKAGVQLDDMEKYLKRGGMDEIDIRETLKTVFPGDDNHAQES